MFQVTWGVQMFRFFRGNKNTQEVLQSKVVAQRGRIFKDMLVMK